jgi:hypothetical protein
MEGHYEDLPYISHYEIKHIAEILLEANRETTSYAQTHLQRTNVITTRNK